MSKNGNVSGRPARMEARNASVAAASTTRLFGPVVCNRASAGPEIVTRRGVTHRSAGSTLAPNVSTNGIRSCPT